MRIAARGEVPCVTSQNLIECWTVCTRPVENYDIGLLAALAVRILSRRKSGSRPSDRRRRGLHGVGQRNLAGGCLWPTCGNRAHPLYETMREVVLS